MNKIILLACVITVQVCATETTQKTVLVAAALKERTPREQFDDAVGVMNKYAHEFKACNYVGQTRSCLEGWCDGFNQADAEAKKHLVELGKTISSEQMDDLKKQLATVIMDAGIIFVELYLDLRDKGIEKHRAQEQALAVKENRVSF